VVDARNIRPGHLFFGLAFAAIGLAWLAADGDSASDAVWLLAVAVGALGLATLATVVAWLVR
jgi:hypothetical protein